MEEKTARKGSHLTFEERRSIAAMHSEGMSPYKIGKLLGRASNTIRNELKRGTTKVIKGYFEKETYFPDTGEAVYRKNRKKCRMPKKIEKCREFIGYVEEQVLKMKRSFASIIAEVLDKGIFCREEMCSMGTLYTYTDRNMLAVKNIDLPEKVRRKPKKAKKDKSHKRLRGKSIETRPESINNREEFGHWEIDLVIGKKTADDNVLLTLTERKTKKEIVRKIKDKSVKSVHRCLKQIKKKMPHFDKVFRSITTDNGSEFAWLYELEKTLGIDVYYAHPYSSWERGLNENTNRIVRRFVPKGEPIRSYSRTKIQETEDWINTMYRKSLGWKTADQCFEMELQKLLEEAA